MTAKSSKWGAYIDAVLRMESPGGVVWVRPAPVSWRTGQYPDPEGRTICVITAHNPGGQLASDAENGSAQTRLEAELERRGLTWWPAAGGDPSWTHVEASAAVIGMSEADAIALGAQFGQDAIFVLTPADRRVVGCVERRIVATGWSIEPEADGNLVTGGLAAEAENTATGHDKEPEELGAGDADEDEDDSYGEAIWVAVYEENFLTGEKAAGFRDFDDYLAWIGRREGLLCTLRRPEGAVTIHGDGRGCVVIGGEWDGIEGPFPVTRALACLAEAELLESGVEAESAGWGPGDIATLVAPYTDYGEFKIDGMWWSGNDPESPGDMENIVLATVTTEDTGENAYKDGVVYLLRIGHRYVVYQCGDGETIRDDWDAPNDETAVAKFVDGFGPPLEFRLPGSGQYSSASADTDRESNAARLAIGRREGFPSPRGFLASRGGDGNGPVWLRVPSKELGPRGTLAYQARRVGRQTMAGSPYATLAGVLQADVKAAREAFFYHTSRHQCREGECEVREAWSLVRDITTEWLEAARSSPAPERSVTFTMLPPELAAQLAQSGGDT